MSNIVIFLVWAVTLVQAQSEFDKYLHSNDHGKLYQRSFTNDDFEAIFGPGVETRSPEEMTAKFWNQNAQKALRNHIQRKYNYRPAKNVIFFLGDGMSIATLTASRIYKGQLENKNGEEEELSFEKFPAVGLSKTYCVDRQVSDSACTATAYLCGIKGNFFTIGVTANVLLHNCTAGEDSANHVDSVAAWAQNAGKSTGIVTTTRVTHASPAGTYAHTASRMWESDANIAKSGIDTSTCPDIATQLMTRFPGKNFNVILGGGRTKFTPQSYTDSDGSPGERYDGKNLLNIWEENHPNGRYVTNRDELLSIDFTNTSHLLGLFSSGHMNYNILADKTKEPSLAEMTEAAIRTVEKNPKGYFLFIEGGLIDGGHHSTISRLALDETNEFSKAVELAKRITDEKDTSIVVSSDHSHTLTIAGYAVRGNDILGLNTRKSDADELPYATLSYANGPQQYLDEKGNRLDLTGKIDKLFHYPGTVPMTSETHGGDDVAVFANGPNSHIFTGVYEQNLIPHLIAYASCIGKGKTVCN